MKKKIIITGSVLILLSVAIWIILTGSGNEQIQIKTAVTRGPFDVLVYSTGQLEAESSENIVVPNILHDRNIRIYDIKITDLIEEGTVVDSGDYVASLDHKVVEEVLVSAREDLEEALNSFEDAKMDSNLNLSNFRDQIVNAQERVEEMQIVLDESVYESPAVIRKAEMDLEKAKRQLEQEKKAYVLRERQAVSRVDRNAIELRDREKRVELLMDVVQSLRIHAPKKGMVIYGRDRTREKIQIGSSVSAWNPIIATLPDLSSMLSITWVNEIDISKVKTGQKVVVGIDALPDKILDGEVISVANIGQPMPRSDAKVFEVRIKILGDVSGLKPAMTTSNVIQTASLEDTLFIPAEAVFENDSLQYVFLEKEGTVVRQVVDPGEENENYVLIRKGLNEHDEILLTRPEKPDDYPMEGMDLYEEIKARRIREEQEARDLAQKGKKEPERRQKKEKRNEVVRAE